MEWMRSIDAYCERIGPGFWAEPVNAVTNLAFVIVAFWLWRRAHGVERILCAVLLTIGVGSWLFHTYAVVWAGIADSLSILVFILVYIFAAKPGVLGFVPPTGGFGCRRFHSICGPHGVGVRCGAVLCRVGDLLARAVVDRALCGVAAYASS